MAAYDLPLLINDFPKLQTSNGGEIQFSELVQIDPDNVAKEFEMHTAWQATLGFAHAAASQVADAYERKLDIKKADLSFYLRKHMEKEAGIKPTVDAVASAIKMDEEVNAMEEELSTLRLREKNLEVAVKAFMTRKEMLISLGAELRADRK